MKEEGGEGKEEALTLTFSHLLPVLLLAPFFARPLTFVPCSLLRNRTETLATQAIWAATFKMKPLWLNFCKFLSFPFNFAITKFGIFVNCLHCHRLLTLATIRINLRWTSEQNVISIIPLGDTEAGGFIARAKTELVPYPWWHSIKFSTVRLCPEVQPLTLFIPFLAKY